VLAQNNGKNYPMVVTIRAGTRNGTVAFPGERCKGTLTFRGRNKRGQYRVRETIRQGVSRCVELGEYTIWANKQTLVLSYVALGKHANSGIRATATLIRQDD
jgi:hypothetical protein